MRDNAWDTSTQSSVLSPQHSLRAATLVATYETRRGPRVILTRRPDYLRRHPGQIAFPGGMIESIDPSPFAAAVREAREEIGLVVPPEVVGEPLAPVTTRSSEIVIQPFWVRLAASPRLRPDPVEVAEVLRVPLADLQRPELRATIPHPRRANYPVPACLWRGHVIWGATLQTIDDLVARQTSFLPRP